MIRLAVKRHILETALEMSGAQASQCASQAQTASESESDVEFLDAKLSVKAERNQMSGEDVQSGRLRNFNRMRDQLGEAERKVRRVFSREPLSMEDRERIRSLLSGAAGSIVYSFLSR